MPLFLLLLAMVLVGAVWAVAVGRIGGGLDQPASTRPYRPLPQGRLVPEDVHEVRFTLGLRGYRMDEVDSVLDRLAVALALRDDEIRDLHRRLDGPGPGQRTGGDRLDESAAARSAAEPRAVEPRAAEPRAAEPRAVEARADEISAAEPRAAETRAAETRAEGPTE